jgi:hypothetical protein
MGAFTHPHEAKMSRGRRFRCVEALSIVLDHQTDVTGVSAEDYANRLGFGVLTRVRQSLLHHSVERDLELFGKAGKARAGAVKIDHESVGAAHLGPQTLERFLKPQIVEHARAKPPGDALNAQQGG